jgi:putative peptide zinc metalloprotease protein
MPYDDASTAATSRSLPLRVRADVEIRPVAYPSGNKWVIKDAVAQRFWMLDAEEHFLLQSLDGVASLSQICDAFAEKFAPRRITAQQLTGLVARFHQEGLLTSTQPGQTTAVLDRRRQWRKAAPWRFVSQILAWRFRGVDPDRMLGRMTPRLGWLFSGWSAALYAILLISAIALAISQWPRLVDDIRTMAASFDVRHAIWLVAAIAIAKALHELGHAVACKHFGGECHEIGVLLLLGAPSLYCNVSDAWLLLRKRDRILISAAGILVELALAAAAAWLWWLTQAGLVHSLALQVMLACSLNTLLLNGNPLLQYDGYYVLADACETPNLREQSSAGLRRMLARVALGIETKTSRLMDESKESWLVLYAAVSTAYRLVIGITVLWFLAAFLKPYDLEILVWLVGMLLLGTFVGPTVARAANFFRRPAWDREVRWTLVAPRLTLLATGALALLAVPLPSSVVTPAVLEPRGARPVYVNVEGRLAWIAEPGAAVNEGDVIARLENFELEREVTRLAGQRSARRQRLQSLLRRRAEADAAAQVPTAEKALADIEEQLSQRQRDLDRLRIVAPRSGVVLPDRKPDEKVVSTWSSTPLDPENLGCYLEEGDVLCQIGEPRLMDAMLLVRQEDTDLVQDGQTVELLLDPFPNRQLSGVVAARPLARAATVPDELLASGLVEAQRDRFGDAVPRDVFYSSRAELTEEDEALLAGSPGWARVEVAPQSIAERLMRFLRQTFRSDW